VINCLDCGHGSDEHDLSPDAGCLMDCPCTSLHLDVGDCDDHCYEVNYRSCDECGKVEFHDDCSPYDWVNGVCETCDPYIILRPENIWRESLV